MSSFVMNPFTTEASFDIWKYKNAIYIAQRLMDDIIDLEYEKLDAIINKIKSEK